MSALFTTLGAALLGVWVVEALFFLARLRSPAREEDARPVRQLL